MRYTRTALGLLNAQYRSVLKKCFMINMGLFALGASVGTANAAITLAPTLDTIKTAAEQDGAISSEAYELTKLASGETLPEGVAAVRIGSDVYYFSPKDNQDAKLLSILAGTPVATVNDISNPTSITFDVANISSKFPSSVFGYAEGTENDYNFVVQEADESGNISKKYYKVVIDTNRLGTSQNISWEKLDAEPSDKTNVVEVKLPNDKTEYYKYTYTPQAGRKVYKTCQKSLSGDVDADFKGASVTGPYPYGGAIYNGFGTINSITGDFIGNYNYSDLNNSLYGGAIFNESDSKINSITGNFVGNYVSSSFSSYSPSDYYVRGGAIYNGYLGSIGSITGNFVGNYASTNSSSGSYAMGGAIYNGTSIDRITGNFIGNYVSDSSNAYGGAIYNSGTIGNITGDFVGNYASNSSYAYGGAIYNSGTIGNITGDFIGNYASANSSNADSGAIFNGGTINSITGDFVGNYASSSYFNADGGAIFNSGTINSITGDFIGNYAVSENGTAQGGAIYNIGSTADISGISGNFENNYIISNNYNAYGGAIFNEDKATIGDISGKFIENFAETKFYDREGYVGAAGGAIANQSGTINNISGEFSGNYAKNTSGKGAATGGAIVNRDSGKINGINAVFSNNYAESENTSQGGAIYNYKEASIGDISGKFSGNYVSSKLWASAGAIRNIEATIGNIIADFENNHAYSEENSAYGGAIENNSASMGNINGSFIGNYAQSEKSHSNGGAIYNYDSVLNDINGSFIGNYLKSKYDNANYFGSMGGAIYNGKASIKNITGNFVDNYVEAAEGSSIAGGGAIYNRTSATIEKLQGDFENNYSKSEKNKAYGGAILNWNNSKIDEIEGDFSKNYVVSIESTTRSGAIDNSSSSSIGNITGNFTGNYAQSEKSYSNGGAIYNLSSTINEIKGNFTDNYALGGLISNGGAVNNNTSGIIGSITGDFEGNYAESNGGAAAARGGALINFGNITNLTANFSNNHALTNGTFATGGAISNRVGNVVLHGITTLSGNFTNNYAKTTGTGENAYAQGGAIHNDAQMNIDDIASSSFIGNYVSGADTKTDGGAIWNAGNITFSGASEFTGNYAEQGGTKRSNAIYNEGTINFNSGDIVLNDAVTGNGGVFNLTGQTTENSASDVITVNNQVSGNTMNLTQGLLKLGSYNSAEFGKSVGTFADDVNFAVSGGALTTQDGETNDHNLGNLQLDADLNTAMDVDLANVKADVFGGASANGEHSLILNDIKAITDTDRHILKVKVADENIKDKMTLAEASERLSTADNTYLVEYEKDATSGNLKFGNIKALETAVQFKKADKNFEMSEDAVIETDLGALKNDGLNIIGNNHTIDGAGFGGMTIANGQSASLSDATVKGFAGAFAENNGTLNIKSDTSTNLESAISGTGTINANGAGKLNVRTEISGNTLNLNQGVLSFERNENGNMGTFADDVNFVANGGALTTQDGETNDHNLGNLQLKENLNTAIDVDLANVKADTMTGSSEAVSSNGSKVLIENIKIVADSSKHIIKVRVADNNLKNSTALADSVTVAMNPADTNSYLVVYETDDLGGNLKFGNIKALETAVQFENANKVFAMGKDAVSDTDLGSLVGDKLTISGNNHTIDGAGFGGMTIANGQTVSLSDVTVKGFAGAFAENNGTLNIKSDTSTNLESAISGTGTINVNGGEFNLNSDITAGSVNMNNGNYNLNGNITADNMHVNGGEFNLDNGSELAEVNNFVADGGVLNVGDQTIKLKNATFNDGSIVKINVKDNGNGLLKADNLVINGGDLKASLGQGIVDLTNKQKIVTLLESGTDFTDNFASVADNNMYRFEKAEKAGDYIISLIKTAEDVSRENAGTENNANEAKAWVDGSKFEQGSVSADVADKLADLAQNDGKQFNDALTALAPSDTPIVRTTSVNHSVESFSAVTSHLNENYQKNKIGLSSGDSYIYNDVSAWARAFGNHTKVDDNSKSYGFSSDNYGVSLGVDKQLNTALKVGAGYSYFANDISGFMRDSDVDTHAGFVYAEYSPNNWYINAVASYGYSEYDETKHVAGNNYKGKFDVDNLGAQVMTGYNATVAKTDVTPEIGLRYNNIHRDDYVDDAGQAVKAETMDVMTAIADVKVGKDLVSCFGTRSFYWHPEARLAATYDFISDKENAAVTLPNGAGYFVNGQRLNRFGIEAGAGVTFYLTPQVESSIGYEGKFRKDYADHTGYVSAKYKF